MKLDVKRVVSLNHVSRLSHIYLSTLPSPCKPIISALILHQPSISLRPPPQSCRLLLAAFFFLHFTAQILHHVRGFDPRLSPCLARLSSPLYQTFTLNSSRRSEAAARCFNPLITELRRHKVSVQRIKQRRRMDPQTTFRKSCCSDTDGGGRSTQILHCYYYK